MFTDLKPHRSTKEAGLPWLKSIPSDWRLVRAKEVLQSIDRRSLAGEEELLTVSSHRGVVPRSGENVTMFRAGSYVGHKLCWPDDLVINSLWAWGKGLGVSAHHGIVSTAYGVYRRKSGKELNPRYLHELVRSEPFNWELQYRSRGVWISRLQLTDDRFLAAPLVLPPADEQAAIVKYLGHAHARIDRAIAAKRKLIALLEEQKRATIHHAVTRGLDPNAPMKDSGIPWLGEIPEHWTTAYLRSIGRFFKGRGGSREDDAEEGSACIRYGDLYKVNSPTIRTAPTRISAESVEDYVLIAQGDILFALSGESLEDIGKSSVCLIPEPTYCGGDTAILRVGANYSPEFLAYALSTRNSEWQRSIRGRGDIIVHLGVGALKQIRVATPPLVEQRAIASHISSAIYAAKKNLVAIRREIDLLREFRTRLTSDVVTGQIDIRGIAATLPDFADELSANDDAGPESDELLDQELDTASADE